MSAAKTCHSCGQLGHLAHYCPDRAIHAAACSMAEWIACERGKSNEELVEVLGSLLAGKGWVSRTRTLCRLAVQCPEFRACANAWRDEEGHSLLSRAVDLKLRNSIRLLWSTGITSGIDKSSKDSWFIVMKMCDARHGEDKYGWFIGKSEFAARLEREGAMIDACVRVSLIWQCTDDLDLHVVCPSGEEICYKHKTSACGGKLDVDMNARDPYSRAPVENIVWAGDAPIGEYGVIVNNFCHRARQQTVPFEVEIAVQGREPLRINSRWEVGQGTGDRTLVHTFLYCPEDLQTRREQDSEEEEENTGIDRDLVVQHMNRLAGTRGEAHCLAQTVWLTLRQRDRALFDVCFSLGLHNSGSRGTSSQASSCVSPQWCFLQAVWAHNLHAAERLLSLGGQTVDVNHKYRWDAVPWDETVAQMCWRECHGDEVRDRPWMKDLAWLARQGADFSQVKLNFHRWRKPFSMQESQIRTFNRLIWHLSDENGWSCESRARAAYLGSVVRQLAHWGVHVPQDLDPDYNGDVEWGVNGKRPADANSFCYGRLDVELVHAAVREGKATNREHITAALLALSKAHPELQGSLRCLILRFLYPSLGQGRLEYAALQKSEGGRVKGPDNERVVCTEDSAPPRGYVCGRCRQAGHWRQFCPRGRS